MTQELVENFFTGPVLKPATLPTVPQNDTLRGKLSPSFQEMYDNMPEREVNEGDRFTDFVDTSWMDEMEARSRDGNPMLWDLYERLSDNQYKVPVEFTDNHDLDVLVIGNYEVRQGAYNYKGVVNLKVLKIMPHSGEYDMSKFEFFAQDAEEAALFFEGHFTAYNL